MYNTLDPMADHQERVARSLRAYDRRARALAGRPPRKGWFSWLLRRPRLRPRGPSWTAWPQT